MNTNPCQSDASEPGHQTYSLSTGILDLTIDSPPPAGLYPDGLFKIAERQNPKRAFLFVSTILGRHIPVDPRVHRAAVKNLSRHVAWQTLNGPIMVMGMAETAIGLGAAVFDELRHHRIHHPIHCSKTGYLPTTRHPVNDWNKPVWFCITESHSHAPDHCVIQSGKFGKHAGWFGSDSTLVLVDDETTTGTTLAGLAEAMIQRCSFGKIVVVTLTDWSGGTAAKRVSDTAGGIPTESVSLMSGSWVWSPDRQAIPPVLPETNSEHRELSWKPTGQRTYQTPREGLDGRDMSNGMQIAYQLRNAGLPPICGNDRLLVIGTGEHVWQPFLFAEVHADMGSDTGFIATTRSPILPGSALRHKMTFPDHFRLGQDMYLHNVNPDDWDHIVLFTETDQDGIHPDLRNALGKGHVIDGNGFVQDMMDFRG